LDHIDEINTLGPTTGSPCRQHRIFWFHNVAGIAAVNLFTVADEFVSQDQGTSKHKDMQASAATLHTPVLLDIIHCTVKRIGRVLEWDTDDGMCEYTTFAHPLLVLEYSLPVSAQ
jgi:hypothetical protein